MSPAKLLLTAAALLIPCIAQTPRAPNLETQRAAMKKLDLLIGKWTGDAKLFRGGPEPIEVIQTGALHTQPQGTDHDSKPLPSLPGLSTTKLPEPESTHDFF
jgi:hypothetical protein